MRFPRARAPVYDITGARKGLSDDVTYRQRRYVISMGIRTVCFLLAVAFEGPMRWVMLVAALVVPYFAVVFANGGREPAGRPPPTFVERSSQELPVGNTEKKYGESRG